MTNFEYIKSLGVKRMARLIVKGISSDPCDYCKFNECACDEFYCENKKDEEIIAEWLKREKDKCI